MYKRIFVLAIVVISLTPIIWAEQQQVQAALSLIPENTLPGVPVSIRLLLSNSGSSAVVLPKTAILRISPEQGEPFEAVTGSTENPTAGLSLYFNDNKLESLPPRQTKEFYFGIDSRLAAAEWFHDARLSWPGRYKLQMVLETLISPHSRNEVESISEPIISSLAFLTVEEPHGEDLLVWQSMLGITNGKGWGTGEWSSYGFDLAKEIWELHRTSSYTPYVIIMVPSQQVTDRVERIEQALLNYPNHPMTSYFHSVLANLYETQMWSQLALKNLHLAKSLNEKWQTHLRAVIETSNDPSMRKRAEEDSIATWDRVSSAYKERHNPVDQKP